MGSNVVKATVKFAGDDLFIGITPSAHAVTLDTNHDRNVAPSPVELLLIAVGSCTAVDVISILNKKRQSVAKYYVEVSGERREEHPRSFKSMNIHHVLRGESISKHAVEQAIELSETKYCSVAATLRPTVEIHSSFEIIQEESR